MGSWNGTCGVSQLPVMYGDHVAIFFMVKSESGEMCYNGCIYSDDIYKPVGPAIFGKYVDYGRYSDIQADDRVIESLFENKDDYDNIAELINEESKSEGLYIMTVHLNLYNAILEEFGSEKDYFTENLPFADFIRKRLINFIQDKRENMLDEFSLNRKHWAARRSLGFEHKFYENEDIYANELTDEPLIESLVDFSVFKNAMSLSRKLWVPQAGKGSQDYDFRIAKEIGRFAVEKEEENNEKWEM